jgi:hypothetical protein
VRRSLFISELNTYPDEDDIKNHRQYKGPNKNIPFSVFTDFWYLNLAYLHVSLALTKI